MKYFRNVYIQYIAIHVLKWVYFSPGTKLADKQSCEVVKISIDNLSIIRVVWLKTCDFVNSNSIEFFLLLYGYQFTKYCMSDIQLVLKYLEILFSVWSSLILDHVTLISNTEHRSFTHSVISLQYQLHILSKLHV